jgi:hypothetical protein
MELECVCTIIFIKRRKNEVIWGCPKIFLGYVLALLDTVVAFKYIGLYKNFGGLKGILILF